MNVSSGKISLFVVVVVVFFCKKLFSHSLMDGTLEPFWTGMACGLQDTM